MREAKNSKTLTIIGLVFIPLAYTSALFSMSDEYRPGRESFWVYWVTAVPIMVLVFGATWMMQRGWDELGRWGWERLIRAKAGQNEGKRKGALG